jgi:hypothetical protein
MNTWVSWAAGFPAGVVLHSVPPLVVVIAAEAVTDVQHALTQCVHRAHTTALHTQQRPEPVTRAAVNGEAPDHPQDPMPPPDNRTTLTFGAQTVTGHERSVNSHERSGRQLVNAPVPSAQRTPRPVGEPHHKPRKRSRPPVRRKLLADYLTGARAAWTPGVVVTPAWVRQVTDCSRGLSPKVAAALNAELPTGRHSTAVQTTPEGRAA